MKKHILIILLIYSVYSCKTFNLISEQEIKRNFGSTNFQMISNQMIVKPTINGKTYDFIFDTGAGFVVNDSMIYKDVSNEKITDFGFIKLPDGSFTKKKNIVLPFSLGYAKSENTLFTQLSKYKFFCKNKYIETAGIIGLNYINSINLNDTFVCLNFTNNSIDNFSELDLKNKLIDFSEIKSKFHYSGVYVFLNIGGKEKKLFFDTGNAGSLILNEDFKESISKNVFETEGNNYFSFKKKIVGQNKLYANELVKIGSQDFITNVNYSSNISRNNLGIKFIKAFDWILDFKHKKIYFKKNKNDIDNLFKIYNFLTSNVNNRLLIMVKEKSQTKYNLGDEITSVNNTKITPENICEMQDLLNKTEDWNTLNIEIKR